MHNWNDRHKCTIPKLPHNVSFILLLHRLHLYLCLCLYINTVYLFFVTKFIFFVFIISFQSNVEFCNSNNNVLLKKKKKIFKINEKKVAIKIVEKKNIYKIEILVRHLSLISIWFLYNSKCKFFRNKMKKNAKDEE